MNAAEERKRMMLEDPVSRVIPRLAVPTIISMLISTIYNMADTYFVSQISTAASGAVGVIFSAMAMVQALAFMLGIGAGNYISRQLGSGRPEEARRFAAVSFFTAFGAGMVILVFGNMFISPLVRLLGATETIAPFAEDYARYIFFGAPFMMCSVTMNCFLRFSGLASYAMVGITTGGILNMGLDPIFIFTLNLGTAGAAIATALSQFISFCILLAMCQLRPDALKIQLKYFRPTPRIYRQILLSGLPSFGRQGIASVGTIALNHMAGPYGDAAIAAMGIVNRFAMFLNSSIVGFGQGFQPMCGFNYGAKQYARVREGFWFCVKVSTCLLIVFTVLTALFSSEIIALFRRDDPEVIAIGTLALRLQLITVPLLGWNTMSNMITQTIGYSLSATLLSTARQGIYLVPLLLILPRFMGLNGVLAAQPIADALTVLTCVVVMRRVLRDLRDKERELES